MTRWILPMVVLLSVWSAQAWAANVYWASTAGSNSPTCANIKSTGTADSPGSDPGSYGTINGAANCATGAGDIVNIKAGTYTGSTHKIILNGATTGLASGTSESVRTYVQGNPSSARSSVIINIPTWFIMKDEDAFSQRAYVTIRHLTVDGSGGGNGDCELTIEGQYITLDDLEVKNPGDQQICAFRKANTNVIHHLVVKNSLIHGQSADGNGYGIYLNADDITVQNNEVYDKKGGFIQLYDTVIGARSDRSIIKNNYLHDVVTATQQGYTGCFGIAVDGANDQIYNNIITNGPNCTAGAIETGFDSASSLTASNNTVYNFSIGFQSGLNFGTHTDVYKNNLLPGLTIAGFNGATFTDTTNIKTGTITNCTVSTSDFSLKAGTNPCVDTGTTVSAVTTDYLGTARPQGVAYDIGAYERIGNSGGGGGGGGGSAACTTIASDMYNRAAGALGANWQANTTADVLVIRSPNVAQATIADYGSDALSSWIGAGTFTDDQCADVTLATSNTLGNYSAGYGPAVRVSPTVNTQTGYSFIVGTLGWELRRDVAGSFLSLAHNTTPAFNTGDVAQLIVSGSSPPLLAMNRNGTALDLSTATVCGSCVKSGNTVTDGNASAITTGIPGISYSSATQNLIDTPTVGIASWAGSSYVSTDVTIPTVPTGLTVTPNLPNQLLVSWTASTDDVAVVNYTLQFCTPHSCSNFATISTTASVSFTHTGLPNNTVYSYQVRANDGAGNSSAYTAAVEGTTLPSTQVPVISNPIPTGSAVVDASPITISVNTDIPAVCKYNTRTEGTAAYASLTHTMTANALVNSASVTPDQHTSNSGVNHFYIACDNAASTGHASATTDMTFTMIAPGDATKPSTVTNLTVNALDAVRIQLNWTAATDNTAVTGYNAYCSSGIGTPIVTYNTDPVNATPALVVGAVNTSAILTRTLGVVYNCVVDAFDAAGNIALDSNIATAQTFAPLSPPTLLHEVGPPSNNIITVIWNPSTDQNAAGYNVYQSTTLGVIGQLVLPITSAWAIAHHTTMTQFTTVVGAGTYYFTITATDSSGAESLGSNQLAVVRTGTVARTLRVP